MTEEQALERVIGVLRMVIEEKGVTVGEIAPGAVLLGGDLQIDSLDLATIVVELEQRTGIDPFKNGFINFSTVGELAKLYAA